MGKLKTFTRRSFLIGSSAIAGGVAFGGYAALTPHDNPLQAGLKRGEASFNPWVKISADGITLITPHADKGQGAMHAQAILIAEEMDLDLGQYETSFGMTDAAYYNSALVDESVPFMSRDESGTARTVRTVMGAVIKLIGVQITGGSSTMPDGYDKLRMAGACARETLKLAAAQTTGLAVDALKTASGAVVLPDGSRLPYTELAEVAATLDPVEGITLRDPADWKLVGQPTVRQDIVAKSTGTLDYGIDLVMDGMVHASVRYNPRKGGAMNSFDASAAKGMRGVQKVVPVQDGAAVIADNTWRAIQAVNAIEFDWGDAPYPAEQDDHWAVLGDSFTSDRLNKEWVKTSNFKDVWDTGEILSAEYRAPYVAHQPLEPLSALIVVTDERADIWVGHQIPAFAEIHVAKITGLATENVHLHNQFCGGSFGHRLEFDNIRYAAEVGMAMKGTPVKLTYSREEDFAHDYTRPVAMARPRGVVKDGKVVTYDLPIAAPSVTGSQLPRAFAGASAAGPDPLIVAGAWNMPYAIENLRVSGFRAPELAPISSWRSVGASYAGFFGEGFMDELLIAAGQDPMEGRIALCNFEEARKTLEAVAEMSNWGSDLGPNRGRGVAMVSSFGVPCAEVIEVTNTPDGIQIDKVFVAAEVGQVIDPVNFENQVQGGVVWALGHAINSEITYSDGMAEQSNFDSHEGMRMYQCPEIHVRGLENSHKIRGVGEPPVPPAAPALANAIFNATGTRLREMPFYNFVDFV